MVSISIDSNAAPNLYVLDAPERGAFIVMHLDDVSVYLPGFNAENAAYARDLAARLLAVADAVDQRIGTVAEGLEA